MTVLQILCSSYSKFIPMHLMKWSATCPPQDKNVRLTAQETTQEKRSNMKQGTLLRSTWCTHSLFCFVHIGTFLAQIKVCLIAGINPFNLQKSCVLPLVSKTSLVASKSGLGPQPRKQNKFGITGQSLALQSKPERRVLTWHRSWTFSVHQTTGLSAGSFFERQGRTDYMHKEDEELILA